MVRKVNHKELKELLKHYYKIKLPLFIWGRFGIGKSFVVKETAKEIAEERGRKFIEWNRLTFFLSHFNYYFLSFFWHISIMVFLLYIYNIPLTKRLQPIKT